LGSSTVHSPRRGWLALLLPLGVAAGCGEPFRSGAGPTGGAGGGSSTTTATNTSSTSNGGEGATATTSASGGTGPGGQGPGGSGVAGSGTGGHAWACGPNWAFTPAAPHADGSLLVRYADGTSWNNAYFVADSLEPPGETAFFTTTESCTVGGYAYCWQAQTSLSPAGLWAIAFIGCLSDGTACGERASCEAWVAE
jgi:hypothetical protein